MDEIRHKNICFGVFSRFGTSALTLTLSVTYIFLFPELFGFCIFLSDFVTVFEAASQLILL